MNLDILDAAVYDDEEQSLTLKTRTAGAYGEPSYGLGKTSYYWDVMFTHIGEVNIAVNFSNSEDQAGAEVKVDIDGQCVTAVTPYSGGSQEYMTMGLQSVCVNQNGLVTVKLHITPTNEDEGYGDVEFLKLTGPAAAGTVEDMVPLEIALVCLEAIDAKDYQLLYTCVTPTLSHISACYEVCRFDCGYLYLIDRHYEDGCQKIGVRLFETGDTVVPDEEQTITTIKTAHGLQDELLNFSWNINENYHFIVKAERIKGESAVMHSSFVYMNDLHAWKLIAMHKVTNKSCLLSHVRQGIRRFDFSHNGYFAREAMFGPTWCRFPNGEWKQLSSFHFTEPLNTLLNINAGVKDNRFFLRTGGRTVQTCKLGSVLTVEATELLPDILKDIDQKLSMACECAESKILD